MPVPEKLRRFFDFVGTIKKRWTIGAAVLIDDTPDNLDITVPANQYQIDLRKLANWQKSGIPWSNMQGSIPAIQISWVGIQDKPTTIAGFGITDAASAADIQSFVTLTQVQALIDQSAGGAGGAAALDWVNILNKPDTVEGFGISDALTPNSLIGYATEPWVNSKIAAISPASGGGSVPMQSEYLDTGTGKAYTVANLSAADKFADVGKTPFSVTLPAAGTRDGAVVWVRTNSKSNISLNGALTDLAGVNSAGFVLPANQAISRFRFVAATGRWFQI